jgi:Predicted membrane protein
MNSFNIMYACISLFGVFISSVSQVFLKKASQKKYSSFIKEYLNFPVITAYSIFVIATLLSVYAYKVLPLSIGPILESTSYIYVTIFGITIFKEKINTKKVIALILMVCGIIVYAIWG